MKYTFLAFLMGILFNYSCDQVGTYLKYSAATQHCMFTPVGAMCDRPKLSQDWRWTVGEKLTYKYPLWEKFVDDGQD